MIRRALLVIAAVSLPLTAAPAKSPAVTASTVSAADPRSEGVGMTITSQGMVVHDVARASNAAHE